MQMVIYSQAPSQHPQWALGFNPSWNMPGLCLDSVGLFLPFSLFVYSLKIPGNIGLKIPGNGRNIPLRNMMIWAI